MERTKKRRGAEIHLRRKAGRREYSTTYWDLSFHDVLVDNIRRSKSRLTVVEFHVETLLDLDRAGAEGRLMVWVVIFLAALAERRG